MWKEIRENPRALLYAVLVHLVLVLFLVFSLDWTPKRSGSPPAPTIQAEVVDDARVQAEMEKLRQAEENKRAQEETRKRELEQAAVDAQRKREQEEQRLEELKRKQVEEERRVQELENKRQERIKQEQIAQAEAKRKAELEAKQKAAAEAKRKAEAEAKKKAEAEAKRKAEEAAKKAAAEAAAKKKAEAETKRKAEEARRRAEAERMLRDQLAREEAQSLAEQYIGAIEAAVTGNWLRPPTAQRGLVCTIRVNLIPGGEVVGVRVVESSGDPAFDRSAETAVRKASPLPVPSDPAAFEMFRDFQFRFRPEN